MKRTLRIACYGYAENDTGSVNGANYLVLDELLKIGHKIDFYGWQGKRDTNPSQLSSYPNFHYIPISESSLSRQLINAVPLPFSSEVAAAIYAALVYPSNSSAIRRAILANHKVVQYDVLLFLGLFSPIKVDGVTTVSWIQGPPGAEWLFIQKLKHKIIELSGVIRYLQLKAFYVLKAIYAKTEVESSDVLICCSSWAKQELVKYGVNPEKIKVLPYPMNLDYFTPSQAREDRSDRVKTFLWLGRIDPRKRLDLLLEAYQQLLKERKDVHLKIIGSIRYVKGYGKLLDEFEFPEYLEYERSITRSQVPDLMANCDILIQPSEGETFGSSVAEALCCGLPVIIGPTNGTKDYVGSSSFIFDQYTAESLKRTMVEALNAVEHDRETLALESRRAAEANFSLDKIMDCLQDIFEQLPGAEKMPHQSADSNRKTS